MRTHDKHRSGESGQMLLIVAVVLTGLLGTVGLVIDGGYFLTQRRHAQNTADAAALAAVNALREGAGASTARAAALEYAAANGYDDDGTHDDVTVNIPPSSGPNAGKPGHAEVVIRETPPTFFIHVLVPGGDISARGVAAYVIGDGVSTAIFANENSCGVSDALEISGSVSQITGGVHSNAHLKIPGSDTDFTGEVTYVCGLDVGGSGNTFDPDPSSSPEKALPVDYDFGDFPCDQTFTSDTDLGSVASVWKDNDPDTKELKPGVYCSTKKLTLSGSDVTGQVTLVAQQEMSISGGNFHLTPYWNGVLLYSASSSASAMDISGSGGEWEGIMLAPNGTVKLQGSGNLSILGSVIGDRVKVSGSNYTLTGLELGGEALSAATLVE